MGLEHILDDSVDLSDPACMAKVQIYMEELQMEDDNFIEILVENTVDEAVYWLQPWYQQSTVLTRKLKENGDDKSSSFREDKITKEEDEIIDKNWENFVQKYNIPNTPICFARYKQKPNTSRNLKSPFHRAKIFTTAFLAQGLSRTLPQVYRHFVTKYGSTAKGAYSQMELKIMDVVFKLKPSNATTLLTTVLGRHERGINKRCQLTNGYTPVKSRVKWTLARATTLLNGLIRITGRPFKKLRKYEIDKEVWVELSKEMDMPYHNIRLFWLRYLHVQLYVKEEVTLVSVRDAVFKILKNKHYKIWSDVRWNEVVKEFPKGYTSIFLYSVTHPFLMRRVPKYQSRPLKEAAKIARKLLKTNTYRNYKIKRLYYEDNKLAYEPKEIKMEE